MAKYNPNKIPYIQQDAHLENFCEALVKLKTKEDLKDFLKDLMNRQERIMFIRRLQIAEYLIKGFTYSDIRKKLRVGENTISRVARWLNFGRNGYKKILEKKIKR